jgi:glucose uptake protein GlcU
VFRPPRDPVEAKRYYFTSFTITGAMICLVGGVYMLDGETVKGLAGVAVGAAVIVVAEYFVKRAKR